MKLSDGDRIPRAVWLEFEAVAGRIESFCQQHLNAEYAALCRRLAVALARKRPSPLSRGDLDIWACAIVYTIGRANFLFDKTQTPHLTPDQLCQLFGVSKSTAAAKATGIGSMFGIGPLDPRWCLPSHLADNPVAWLVEVNGFIIDARHAPRELQEELLRRGMIPFLPKPPAAPTADAKPPAPKPASHPEPKDDGDQKGKVIQLPLLPDRDARPPSGDSGGGQKS